jgi:hypothetical protein
MTVINIAPKVIELPAPQFPMLTRVVSSPIFSDREQAITWGIGAPHPLVPDTYKVIRMFVDRGGVEVYSVSADGKNGMRNLIPMERVRFIEEAMPLDVFVEELDAAESAGDDDDDDEPEETEFLDEPEAVPSNVIPPITS